MKPHTLTHATDLDGREVVGVTLSNTTRTAWLYRADYERVVAEYGTPTWRLSDVGRGHLYVRFKKPGENSKNLSVSRLVAGDYERTGVFYRDGDPLNLRRTNLYHDDGGGRCRKRPTRRAYHPLAAFLIP